MIDKINYLLLISLYLIELNSIFKWCDKNNLEIYYKKYNFRALKKVFLKYWNSILCFDNSNPE